MSFYGLTLLLVQYPSLPLVKKLILKCVYVSYQYSQSSFLLVIQCIYFFYLNFSIFMSLNLKFVSSRKDIFRSQGILFLVLFLTIHSASLCHLMVIFNAFVFYVTDGKVEFMSAILLFIFYMLLHLFLSSLTVAFLCVKYFLVY